METKDYLDLKVRQAQEWNKPKTKNLKKKKKTEGRDYKEIKRLHIQINEHKAELLK